MNLKLKLHWHTAYVQMGYWRRQTCMHQRQTRLPSVTVSACTLPVCQNWSVYRGMGGCQPINESSTCALVCVAAKVWTVYFGMARMPVPDEYTWWHNLLSWRDGEPLSFVIRLKLGVGLKQRLDFDCGVKGHTVAPPLPLPSLPS